MAPERRRAAVSDGAQGATLRAAQRVGVLIRRAMGADDVGQFDPVRPGRADARGGGRHRGHASGGVVQADPGASRWRGCGRA